MREVRATVHCDIDVRTSTCLAVCEMLKGKSKQA